MIVVKSELDLPMDLDSTPSKSFAAYLVECESKGEIAISMITYYRAWRKAKEARDLADDAAWSEWGSTVGYQRMLEDDRYPRIRAMREQLCRQVKEATDAEHWELIRKAKVLDRAVIEIMDRDGVEVPDAVRRAVNRKW